MIRIYRVLKPLTLFLIKFFVIRRAHTASDQLKFFERVWENFCSQKFSQLLSLSLSPSLPLYHFFRILSRNGGARTPFSVKNAEINSPSVTSKAGLYTETFSGAVTDPNP